MFLKSKRWRMVAAIGYGILLAQALTGAVRLTYLLLGTTLPEGAAGNLFLAGSLVAGSISAYLCARAEQSSEPITVPNQPE